MHFIRLIVPTRARVPKPILASGELPKISTGFGGHIIEQVENNTSGTSAVDREVHLKQNAHAHTQ